MPSVPSRAGVKDPSKSASGFRVQENHKGMRDSSRYLPTLTIGAGGNEIRATDAFLNPCILALVFFFDFLNTFICA
jgi:hypothetical protein